MENLLFLAHSTVQAGRSVLFGLSVIIFLLGNNNLHATADDYKIRTVSPPGGLYYDGVKSIEQDAQGFVWVSMDYELYRFDGYEYKKYYPYFAAMSPTKRWLFGEIASDAAGRLYVSTNNGLFRYEQATNRFDKVFEKVEQIRFDGNGFLWVRHNKTWKRIDPKSGEVVVPSIEIKGKTASNTLLCLNNKDVYTFIDHGIYRYNARQNKFSSIVSMPTKSDNRIRFAEARDDIMWLYVDNEGLYEVNLLTNKIEFVHTTLPKYGAGDARDMHIDKFGTLWFGTIDGIYTFSPTNGNIPSGGYQRFDSGTAVMPNKSVWKISEDHCGNLWVGAYGGTLCYIDLDSSNALHVYTAEECGIANTPISAFADNGHILYIGTEGGGIKMLDKTTQKVTSLNVTTSMSSSNIKSMAIDKDDNLWVAMFQGGIDKYDFKRQRVVNYRHDKNDTTSLFDDNIRKTVLEDDAGMWVAY